MKPEQAEVFFNTLSSQGTGKQFLFSVWKEKAGEDKRPIDRFKTFEGASQWLETVNAKGHGVFFVVNETDGGAKWDDITGIRAFFIDVDSKLGTATIPQEAIDRLHPTIIIQSGNGQHAYWVLRQDRDPSEYLSQFESIQEALRLKFNSDPQVKNRNRKMRVPGFYHHKGDPFLVEMIHCDPSMVYSIEDIVAAFDLNVQEQASRSAGNASDFSGSVKIPGVERPLAEGDVEFLREKVSSIPLDTRGERARRELSKKLEGARIAPKRGEAHKQLVDAAFIGNDYGACHYGSDDFKVRDDDAYWEHFSKIVEAVWDSSLSGEPFNIRYIEKEYISILRGARNPWGWAWVDKKVWDESAKIKIRAETEREAAGLFSKDEILEPHDLIRGEISRSLEPRTPDEIALCVMRDYEFLDMGARDFVYFYNGKYWESVTKNVLRKACLQYTQFNQKSCVSVVSNAATIVCSKRVLPSQFIWNDIETYEVPFDNGVLDIRTMTLRPHRPEDMLDRVIPYNYLPKASCPKWERVLEEWLPNPQDRAALRAFFGYILLPQAIYKKALMVYGPPNTGKSIACSIAVALSGGSRFTCSIKPSDMGDPRKVAPIKGKALNLVADLSSDELVSDGGFKQLVSSGDTINIDEKFKPAEAYVPTAKHIFATNNLPHVNDASDAVFDRLMILPFSQQVPKEDRDPMLKEKLVDEMPGIILWALEGAVELFASQGKWPENLSSEEIIANMAEDSNPILEFISESGFIAPAPDAQPKDYIKRSDFCNLFRIWHVSNGGRRWTNRAIISRLRAQGVNVDYKLEGVRRLPGWSLSSQGSVQLNLNL